MAAIRTGWLNDVDLTGRSWWDVAQQVQAVGGADAVAQLLNANFFEQFGSFSAADRAKLWEFVGGARAGEQAAADDGALKSALKAVVGGALVGTTSGATGISVGAGLDPAVGLKLDIAGAGSALMPWLSSALPSLPSVSSFVPPQVSQALTALDTARSALQPGAWLDSVGGVPEFFTDSTEGGGGMADFRDTLRSLIAPLLGNNDSITNAMTAGASAAVPPLLAMGSIPTLGRVGSFLGGAAGAAVGVIRSVGGRILGVILPSGVKVSRKSVVSLAKAMGVQGAATALGIGAVELAEMVMEEEMRKGRGKGRGVTGAQLRTTRRTMRTVERMHRQIVGFCRDTGHAPRRPRTVYVAAPKALPFRRG